MERGSLLPPSRIQNYRQVRTFYTVWYARSTQNGFFLSDARAANHTR